MMNEISNFLEETKRMKKIQIVAAVAALVTVTGAWAKETKGFAQSGKVTKVRVAHTQTYVPYDFVTKDGQSDGFEVAVLKEVDKLLPQYEFEYHPTSDDDLLIGVQSGKYDVGTKGVWVTSERQKKYLFPKNPIAASIIGITFRASDKDKIHDLESFAKYSGKLVPIAPQNAQFAVVQDYNAKHPANQIKLVPAESFDVADAYTWVLEGRYDAYFDIKLSFTKNVLNDGAPYAQYKDKLAYVPYKGIPTWPLFNKKDQSLADAYDKAIETLKANGTISALSQKYFGEDVFKFVTD
jgi:L-cystine transport system substrate-binding protein